MSGVHIMIQLVYILCEAPQAQLPTVPIQCYCNTSDSRPYAVILSLLIVLDLNHLHSWGKCIHMGQARGPRPQSVPFT